MNILEIQPIVQPVDVNVCVPGSKSITNRAMIIASLADGKSILRDALFSDDTRHMAEALSLLGVTIQSHEEEAEFRIQGNGGRILSSKANLFVGNSGTSSRFLTAFLGLGRGTFTVDGIPRLRERPIQDLLDGLKPLGVNAYSKMKNGCPPVVIEASGMRGGRTFMPGNQSSQYFTALLLVAPYAQEDVEIRVTGDLVSKPYIDLTIATMKDFGVSVINDSYGTFTVRAGQAYQPRTYQIEPDASSASYFFAAAALSGGRVKVEGLSATSSQGDVRFVGVLEKMGCTISSDAGGIEVQGPSQLSGIDIDLNAMPDTVQTLCALAPFASGPVTIRNIANLRIKETDRIAALATELGKLGVTVKNWHDGLTVHPASEIRPAKLSTYDDHRMAMSLSLIGLKSPGIKIQDPDCVNKTFPTYFDTLNKLR